MGPSEGEIVARLAELRRRREAIDREIADLMLYLELGRRLGGGRAAPGDGRAAPGDPSGFPGAVRPTAEAGPAPPPDAAWPAAPPAPAPRAAAAIRADGPVPAVASAAAAQPERGRPGGRAEPAASAVQAAPAPAGTPSVRPSALPEAVAFADDPAGARRYGRALIEAARAAILRAGRPLHAGEILEALVARGFTVPGRDPVAALNTRLWKRAGADGLLRRVGEATYALNGDADQDDAG